MDKFSGAVRLADLNDFIAPSQACVVNLKGSNKLQEEASDDVQLQPRPAKGFTQTTGGGQEPVKVTLHDCLACSGCVTSAETVMLEQQSIGELEERLRDASKPVVVSLSPQSRAALAAHFELTPLQAFRKLTGFLRSLGVAAVLDTSCSRDVSLLETCAEFVSRYRDAAVRGGPQGAALPQARANLLPMLASACPGWVCYAEKTHGEHVLPYISTAKSPQQAMGAIVKRFAAQRLGLRPEDVYHVTIMPCYDKKLEASRDDFLFDVGGGGAGRPADPSSRLAEVDCVLTSSEIFDLLQARGVDFAALPEAPVDRLLSNVDEEGHLYGARGGSGGYAECVFRHAAAVLFGRNDLGPVEFRALRNSDFREVSLEVGGERVLRFACAYGFRNIQNLVRKIKAGRSEYDFVEIMACPGGCLNGGGQIKPRKGQTAKGLLQDLESAYLKEVGIRDPADNPIVRGLYENWLGHPYSPEAKRVLHTQYHRREKTVGALVSNW